MNVIIQLARFFVAATFIFSGFVKLVDPLGSAYKFEEYFSAGVLNMEFLIPYALPFSILLILAEIMLGVMLLIGFVPKLTIRSLFVITLLFLFLTWYSAYYNKVTDCGCFGDAITLTPWETFYKNILLTVLIIFLLVKVELIKPIFNKTTTKWITFLCLFAFLYITYHVLVHLPIIDFRAYAVGKNIPEGMSTPEGAKKDVYEDTWIYNVNGENKEFTTEEKPWEIEGATFVDRKTRLIEKGYEPPIHDFTMEMDDVDMTADLMQKEKLLLVVMYNISKSDKQGLENTKKITTKAFQEGYDVYGFSASSADDFEKIKNEFGFEFEPLFCDETTLKTIIRANPGIVVIHKGTIVGKWNANDVDRVKL
ncbi:MAG: DoxX family protein [Flavobacteriaceae bacterium]|nr:DoxX family protein [Flavobacteriaceae bacterium]